MLLQRVSILLLLGATGLLAVAAFAGTSDDMTSRSALPGTATPPVRPVFTLAQITTGTASVTTTPTRTPTGTSAPTDTPTATETLPGASPTATASETATLTSTAGPSSTPTLTSAVTVTPSETVPDAPTETATATSSPSATPTATETGGPPATTTPTPSPTAIPGTGQIAGNVSVQGRINPQGVQILVDGTPVATTGSDGSFVTAPVTAGIHVVRAFLAGYLPAEKPDVQVSAGQTTNLPPVRLRGGDVNGDRQVGLLDLVIVAANYRMSPPGDPRADINADGITDLFDLVLVAANYRKTGPTEWP